tara:strand:+ start:1301 stop:1441 length:141 start_codon:yes stop_codon:yes gene_type:complete
MGKRDIPGIERRSKNKRVQMKKNMSHGTFRAARHPNSKRVRNGSVK